MCLRRGLGWHVVALTLTAGSLDAGPASAQPPPPHSESRTTEFWVALHVSAAGAPGQLDSSFVPDVVSAPDAAGSGRQTLALDPAVGQGIDVGVNVFPEPRLGIQAFVSIVRTSLGGSNTPFELRLRYSSRPPPDYLPVPVEVRTSTAWPETTGHLRQLTLGGGPAVRWQKSPVTVILSGGLAWFRLAGEAQPLAYTRFRLGGHSTLFSEDSRVRAALGATHGVGAYLGGGLAMDVSRRVAVAAALRVLVAGAVDLPARIDAITDVTAGATSPEPREVDAILSVEPVRLSPRRVGITVGFTIR